MESLEQIIASLNKDEKKEFRQYLGRKHSDRKDLKLFEILSQGLQMEAREIAESLYQPVNMNAYHSLRKRLTAALSDYLTWKLSSLSADGQLTVQGLISLARFMGEKSAWEVSAYFIRKAESAAKKKRDFETLNSIYHYQVAHADEMDLNPQDIIRLWEQNSRHYALIQRLDMAYAIMRKKLSNARRKGTTLNPQEIMNSAFSDFAITSEEQNNAAYMLKVTALVRSAVISSKDYYRFEPFVAGIYNALKQVGAFDREKPEVEIAFQYMMAHTCYRLRKFPETNAHLESMQSIVGAREFRKSRYYPKYIALQAAIASFSGRNAEAIGIMQAALGDKTFKPVLSERLNMQVNLAVYFFQAEDYRKANRTMLDIAHSDSWLDEKMGKEWRFKMSMIGLIIQYELGHEDIALQRIQNILKQFSVFMNHPVYQRARVFLEFIQRMIAEPWIVETRDFSEEVKNASLGLPGNQEDIQAITFFCWLKSKMVRRKYYDVLLEAMKNRPLPD